MKTINLSNKERMIIVSELGTLLSAGIPILEAVETVLEDAKGNSKKLLEILKRDLNEGKSVSESFASHKNAFDPVAINLIYAAEKSGNLNETLKDLSKSIKKDMEFVDTIKGALTYPLLVLFVFAIVFLLITVFVIPKIFTVFARLKVEMPLPTKILVFISHALTNHYIPIIIGIVFLIIICVCIYKKKKRAVIRTLFSLPLLSGLAKDIDLTRFTRELALLLESGIPIIEALDLLQYVVTKKQTSIAIKELSEMINSGHDLSQGLKKHPQVFPGIMIRITEAGERSGNLEHSMHELSDYFENRVSKRLKTLTIILEPILLLTISILVGGMMLSIIGPIYNLVGKIR